MTASRHIRCLARPLTPDEKLRCVDILATCRSAGMDSWVRWVQRGMREGILIGATEEAERAAQYVEQQAARLGPIAAEIAAGIRNEERRNGTGAVP